MQLEDLKISEDRPILLAGPTASGKSGLALALAKLTGGTIVNADSLQVYDCWRVLTARPSESEEAQSPHALYGHVSFEQDYSVGDWIRDVEVLKAQHPLIITGGTGLYFRALTEGLADIPEISEEIHLEAMRRPTKDLIGELDAKTLARIDTLNPRRVQRAWEVYRATGKGLAQWHEETPPPLVPLQKAHAFVLETEVDWLNSRIEKRFGMMMSEGALEEAKELQNRWAPERPAAQAIGAPELMAHLRGEIDLQTATTNAIISTRQYAKRQRTWFRSRMKNWRKINPAELSLP